MKTSRQIGSHTEQLARNFLEKKGLSFVANNVNFPFGELDLIMQEHKTLVFIEVRYRRKNNFGNALESITHAKQQRIIKAAQAFLLKHREWQQSDCRFDAVSLTGDLKSPEIEWFKNLW